MQEQIYKQISQYYSEKIIQNGATPKGVDWNGEESQYLRFAVLSFFRDQLESTLRVNDLGCGYGAYISFLEKLNGRFKYRGYDISQEMVAEAKRIHEKHPFGPEFFCISESSQMQTAHYSIASGIFNVRIGFNEDEWKNYILATLHALDHASLKGFAFNALTKYSDQDKMKDYLYYADPLFLFDFCKRHFSRNVALLHDYNLYEFTIIVRKV